MLSRVLPTPFPNVCIIAFVLKKALHNPAPSFQSLHLGTPEKDVPTWKALTQVTYPRLWSFIRLSLLLLSSTPSIFSTGESPNITASGISRAHSSPLARATVASSCLAITTVTNPLFFSTCYGSLPRRYHIGTATSQKLYRRRFIEDPALYYAKTRIVLNASTENANESRPGLTEHADYRIRNELIKGATPRKPTYEPGRQLHWLNNT